MLCIVFHKSKHIVVIAISWLHNCDWSSEGSKLRTKFQLHKFKAMFQGRIPHTIDTLDVDGPDFMVFPLLQEMNQSCSMASVHHPSRQRYLQTESAKFRKGNWRSEEANPYCSLRPWIFACIFMYKQLISAIFQYNYVRGYITGFKDMAYLVVILN